MANSIDVFKKFYSELTKLLPMIITEVVTKLYSDNYLSGSHKGRIDSLPTNEEKTGYFLDKVIKPGLEANYTQQFDEMLRVMKTSDDCAIVNLVDEIHKFCPVSMPFPKQSTPEGIRTTLLHILSALIKV